ncbi:MAG TPA: alanine racemase [Saprospiraceae bacterium]|nr:alanine racemase [Saprospiraceae bacterium]
MLHTCRIEISQSALAHNFSFLREMVSDDVQISHVVKGNAYGHGTSNFVPLAEKHGARHFSVFSADEAYNVLEYSSGKCTVMIMGMLDNEQMKWAIDNDLEFFIFNENRLHQAKQFAEKMGKKAKIHIELETGMNRTGFQPDKVDDVTSFLLDNQEHLHFCGLCTHFAGAESIANYYRIKKQIINFKRATRKVADKQIMPERFHIACSAAAMRYPETQLNMVRLGILQYGFFPSREVLIDYLGKHEIEHYPLERILSWKSKVMDIKTVKSGEFIGYGTSYLANGDMKIATVPVGYSHGFSRSLSNQGRVLIRGQRTSVIGMVNMNAMTVDISQVEGVELGDEVVLIGKQGDLEISVSSFGQFSDQVNYELLTRLPNDIPRLIVN